MPKTGAEASRKAALVDAVTRAIGDAPAVADLFAVVVPGEKDIPG